MWDVRNVIDVIDNRPILVKTQRIQLNQMHALSLYDLPLKNKLKLRQIKLWNICYLTNQAQTNWNTVKYNYEQLRMQNILCMHPGYTFITQ